MATTTRSSALCHCAFFCSNVTSPMNTMTRSSTPRCQFFLFQCYKSLGHNNKELGSSLLCFFGSSPGGPHGHNDKKLNFLSLGIFVLAL